MFQLFCIDVIVAPFFSLENGRCFTLTPINETTRWNSGGYFLYLAHTDMVKDLDANRRSLSGFQIYIHDRRDVYTGKTTIVTNARK